MEVTAIPNAGRAEAAPKIAAVPRASVETLIKLMSDRREVTVRYGRARVTIARWGHLCEGPMWKATRAFRRDELTAEQLCWIYVRRRILSHTPSFDLDSADLDRLLALVTESSSEPEVPNLPPDQLVPVLVEMAEEERTRREESAERLRKSVTRFAIPASVNFPTLAREWRKNLPIGVKAPAAVGMAGTLKTAKEITGNLTAAGSGPKWSTYAAASVAESLPSCQGRFEMFRGALLPASQESFKHVGEALAGISPALGVGNSAHLKSVFADVGLLPSHKIASLSGDMLLGSSSAMAEFRAGLDIRAVDVARGLLGNDRVQLGAGLNLKLQLAKQFDYIDEWRGIGKRWMELFERSLPRNWRDLDAQETIAAGDLMQETGIGLAWAPRTEIVRELIAADGHERRREILEARSEEILADVEEVLDEIEHEQLEGTVAACRLSIAAYRADLVPPAQSHLGTTLTDLAHLVFGEEELRGVRTHFGDVNPRDDVGMSSYTFYAAGSGWARVSVRIKHAGNDFNRSQTVHRLGDHHSKAQFLSALLLATSLAKELERLAIRNERDARPAELELAVA